jgi:hypothetical protein
MIDLTKFLALKVPAAGSAKVGLEPPAGSISGAVKVEKA